MRLIGITGPITRPTKRDETLPGTFLRRLAVVAVASAGAVVPVVVLALRYVGYRHRVLQDGSKRVPP
jgi:hypothetical protein